MRKHFTFVVLVISFTLSRSKEPNLPLCPTNINYFPQDLPMHCRMPRSASFNFPGLPPVLMPGPIPAGPVPMIAPMMAPGSPGSEPMPANGQIPGPGMLTPGMVPGLGMMSPPGPMPMPMPLPMPIPPAPHKLPIIVMPFYKPDPAYKHHNKKRRKKERRRPYISDTDTSDETASSSETDTDADTSSTDDTSSAESAYWRRNRAARRSSNIRKLRSRRKKHHRNHLMPILQYVNKNGYVMYEKKLSGGQAKALLRQSDGKEIEKRSKDQFERLDAGGTGDAQMSYSKETYIQRVNSKEPQSPQRKEKPHVKRPQ